MLINNPKNQHFKLVLKSVKGLLLGLPIDNVFIGTDVWLLASGQRVAQLPPGGSPLTRVPLLSLALKTLIFHIC